MGLYIETIQAIGQSGEKYAVRNFPIPYEYEIPSNWEGVYLFSRKREDIYNWDVVFIGSGNIKDETERILREGLVLEKGVTNIFIHEEYDPILRERKESDIIKGSPECYCENGLNINPYN